MNKPETLLETEIRLNAEMSEYFGLPQKSKKESVKEIFANRMKMQSRSSRINTHRFYLRHMKSA